MISKYNIYVFISYLVCRKKQSKISRKSREKTERNDQCKTYENQFIKKKGYL